MTSTLCPSVVVEGTEAEEVCAVRFQRYTPRAGEALDGDVALQSFELGLWDARH
jgi:hypothetical protein